MFDDVGRGAVARMIYEFGECVLDTATQELARGGELVAVEPQVFAVLELLLVNRDRVVTKIDLLDHVWGDRFVSESALTSRIKLARQACGDSGRAQRLIKTVHGRGYRLVAPTVERGASPAAATASDGAAGRDGELAQLVEASSTASGGEQVTVIVTGPVGAGKSTVVAEFLERTDAADRWLVLRGQCHRTRSGPEPYFALLDAMSGLAATEPDLVRSTLDRVAPSWLLQIPTLVDDEVASRLERRLLGGARQRMLREGAAAFAALARERPTILVVEDLHLADDCTIDVLELVTSHAGAVPLLVMATGRPGNETVDVFVADLAANGSAVTVTLGPLGREAVGELVGDRFPGLSVEPELIDLLHDRCEGNPLFAHEIVTAWSSGGLIAESDGELVRQADPAELVSAVPAGLMTLIERTLDGLDSDESTVLEAAAVAGASFDAASVAAGLGQPVEDVEAILARMARRPDHITAEGAVTWADGTLSTRFRFTHQLHRDVIRERTTAGQMVELNRRIGRALEDGHRGATDQISVALADHFVAARDSVRAARYLRKAAMQAMSRGAAGSARQLLDSAFTECQRVPDGSERNRIELGIRLSLGQVLVALSGWFDPGVLEHYERALELAVALGASGEEANARYGLATISELHGDFEQTEQLLTPLIDVGDGELAMEAHELVACSTFHQGAFERSELNSAAVLSTWSDDATSEVMARVAEHPATSCNSWLSLSNWFLGRSDDSLRRAQLAVELAERHRYALATATQQRAMLHQLRREPDACLEWADRTIGLGRELVSKVRMIQAELFRGWALANLRSDHDDIDEMAAAIDRFRRAGVQLNAPYYLALHADALLRHRRPVEAIEYLDEAEAASEETTRTYFHRPEMRRLRAEAVLLLDEPDAASSARAALDDSVRLAWAMGSPAQALRATCDRFELEHRDGDPQPWRQPLLDIVARYDGQDPPPDVVRARSLLSG